MGTTPKSYVIVTEQLGVGMFVILDIHWLDHDFPRNSFKIKTEEQLAKVKQLGMKKIRIDPARCDKLPQAVDSADIANIEAPDSALPTAEESRAAQEKRERLERINQQRAAVVECEKQFLRTANAMKNININIFSRPQEAHQRAGELVEQMLDSILTNKEIAIHLMKDKIGGEEMYFHALNVTVLAMMLAKELGLPADDIRQLAIGCLFHDIGKLNIPDKVLHKTTTLTRAEQNLLELHCAYGEPIAKKMDLSKQAIDIILQHHECVDGSGYPKQLKAEQISPLARITAIVNCYDTHCNRPNPAESLSPYAALSYMFANQRNKFDGGPLGIFIRCLGVYPPGTVVRLSDGTLGMVVAVNSSKPLRPSVLIYDPEVPKSEAIVLDLQNEPELSISESLKPLQLGREAFEYLNPRKRMTYYFDVPQAGSPTARS